MNSGVTNDMDQELQHFLISTTEGEALEVVRGAEREPGVEQWRRLAALYDPLAAGRSLDDSRQILSPPKAAKIDDRSHTIQEWEIFGTTKSRTHWRPVAQSHAPNYAQMKAQIVTVINSRICRLAPMMMGNLSDEDSNHRASGDEPVESEDGELYRLEIRNGKKVFTRILSRTKQRQKRREV